MTPAERGLWVEALLKLWGDADESARWNDAWFYYGWYCALRR